VGLCGGLWGSEGVCGAPGVKRPGSSWTDLLVFLQQLCSSSRPLSCSFVVRSGILKSTRCNPGNREAIRSKATTPPVRRRGVTGVSVLLSLFLKYFTYCIIFMRKNYVFHHLLTVTRTPSLHCCILGDHVLTIDAAVRSSFMTMSHTNELLSLLPRQLLVALCSGIARFHGNAWRPNPSLMVHSLKCEVSAVDQSRPHDVPSPLPDNLSRRNHLFHMMMTSSVLLIQPFFIISASFSSSSPAFLTSFWGLSVAWRRYKGSRTEPESGGGGGVRSPAPSAHAHVSLSNALNPRMSPVAVLRCVNVS